MAHDSYFVMFVFPLMLLDMVVQFMSIQIQIANGEQRWRHTIFHSIPLRSRQIEHGYEKQSKKMEQQLWSTNKYRCLWLRSLIYMSIQYSFHQRLLAAGCSRVRFTNSILLYHSISVHASSSLLCTKLPAVYLALFALHRHLRPNERGARIVFRLWVKIQSM